MVHAWRIATLDSNLKDPRFDPWCRSNWDALVIYRRSTANLRWAIKMTAKNTTGVPDSFQVSSVRCNEHCSPIHYDAVLSNINHMLSKDVPPLLRNCANRAVDTERTVSYNVQLLMCGSNYFPMRCRRYLMNAKCFHNGNHLDGSTWPSCQRCTCWTPVRTRSGSMEAHLWNPPLYMSWQMTRARYKMIRPRQENLWPLLRKYNTRTNLSLQATTIG